MIDQSAISPTDQIQWPRRDTAGTNRVDGADEAARDDGVIFAPEVTPYGAVKWVRSAGIIAPPSPERNPAAH